MTCHSGLILKGVLSFFLYHSEATKQDKLFYLGRQHGSASKRLLPPSLMIRVPLLGPHGGWRELASITCPLASTHHVMSMHTHLYTKSISVSKNDSFWTAKSKHQWTVLVSINSATFVLYPMKAILTRNMYLFCFVFVFACLFVCLF